MTDPTTPAVRRRLSRLAQRVATLLAGVAVVAAALAFPALPAYPQRAFETDGEVSREPKQVVHARRHMIAAANPHAVEAGLSILRAGGSAVDAAIAAQLVLNLVEPQSSGIGGGAFLMHWNPRTRQLVTYDGRETAPAAIKPDVFLGPDGMPRGFWNAVASGESVGVPGLLRMMELAHARHGRLPWSRLFDPAIGLSQAGFPVSERLHGLLATRALDTFDATARAYFFTPEGKPHAVGTRLANPAFAATLQQIAAGGADVFYRGPLAADIVAAVGSQRPNPGSLSPADLAGYRAKVRTAVCTPYRALRICGMGPPSSGGLATAMTLRMLQPFDLGRTPMNVNALHLIAEAEKLAYADRDRWIGDPEKVAIPPGLLDPQYLARRGRLIDATRSAGKVEAGTPPGAPQRKAGLDDTREVPGTSHLSIVDSRGNAVAMTTSIEAGFGSGIMVGGFLLNNQLTDFSFRATDSEGRPIANAPAPGKRPRSSMAPTMIFTVGRRLVAVLGSPGGSRIPLYVIKSVVGLLDWRLDAQTAADLPNFGNRNGPFEIEADVEDAGILASLRALGHDVARSSMASGAHIIVRRPDGTLEGGADPRREGMARGD